MAKGRRLYVYFVHRVNLDGSWQTMRSMSSGLFVGC